MAFSMRPLLLALLVRAALTSWVYQLGTKNWDSAQRLALDSGDIYVAGETEGSLENVRFGDSDIFVTKLNGSGVPLWSVQRGSIGHDRIGDIKVNSSGDVIIVGFTEASLDGRTWAGGHDVYVMSFDSNGVWQWTAQRGTFYEDHAAAVQMTEAGDIVVAGDTRGALDGQRNAGYNDVLLMKFTGAGDWLWSRQRGSSSADIVSDMQLVGNDFVLTGYTGGDLDSYVNAGGADVFLMKLDSEGSWLWTHQRGSAFEDHGTALMISTGTIYVVGDTRGSLDGNINKGFADIFLMEFDSEGNWQRTQQRGTVADDVATSALLFGSGFAVAGFTQGAMDGNTNAGDEDVFVMEFDQNASWLRTLQWGTAGRDFASAIARVDSSDLLVAGRTSGSLAGFRRVGAVDAFVATMSALDSDAAEAISPANCSSQASILLLFLALWSWTADPC